MKFSLYILSVILIFAFSCVEKESENQSVKAINSDAEEICRLEKDSAWMCQFVEFADTFILNNLDSNLYNYIQPHYTRISYEYSNHDTLMHKKLPKSLFLFNISFGATPYYAEVYQLNLKDDRAPEYLLVLEGWFGWIEAYYMVFEDDAHENQFSSLKSITTRSGTTGIDFKDFMCDGYNEVFVYYDHSLSVYYNEGIDIFKVIDDTIRCIYEDQTLFVDHHLDHCRWDTDLIYQVTFEEYLTTFEYIDLDSNGVVEILTETTINQYHDEEKDTFGNPAFIKQIGIEQDTFWWDTTTNFFVGRDNLTYHRW